MVTTQWCTTWLVKDEKFYLIDVLREKLEYPKLRDVLVNMIQKFNPKAVLEG